MWRSQTFRPRTIITVLAIAVLAASSCTTSEVGGRTLDRATYRDKVHGAWQATMFANHSGLELQGVWLVEPGPEGGVEFLTPNEWSTDDDTHVEYVDLHILETYGVNPTYSQVRDEWVDHLNNDIWVATRAARDLMDDGVLPPETGAAERNPEGVWSMDAQLETELFGLISPGLPGAAREQAEFFARVTNSGLAVDASAFYAHVYSEAFLESDINWLLDRALAAEPADSRVTTIVENVRGWHREKPDDWRFTREQIRLNHDVDPEWWGSEVNLAVTIMALLYGEGDMIETVTIAGLAGWDADNNMTTSAGLLGIIVGFDGLPEPIRSSTDVYFNQDLTGDLPMFDSVSGIANRTVRIGEQVMFDRGARVSGSGYVLPLP